MLELIQKEIALLRKQQQEQHEEVLLELRSGPRGPLTGEEPQPISLPGALPGEAAAGLELQVPSRDLPRPLSSVVPAPPSGPPVVPKDEARPSAAPSHVETSTTVKGSRLKELMRTSQTSILHTDVCISDEILYDQIGVGIFTGAGRMMGGIICVLLILQPTLMGVIHLYGHVHPVSYVWTTITTWFFSLVAVLFVYQIRRAVFSYDLHAALTKLDLFVQNAGGALGWRTMAERERYRAILVWILLAVFFVGLQVIEQRDIDLGLYDSEVLEVESLPLARQLSHVTAALNCMAFLLSSAVVVKGAWFQCNLIVGLSKTVDCWCGQMFDSKDFEDGVGTWNAIQALLKSVGRELAPCFLTLQIAGNLGLVTALAGGFSVFLISHDVQDVHTLAALIASGVSMLPLVVLFTVSARLLGEGGSLTKKCEDVATFINELGPAECDAARQYLVQFVKHSRTGFIVAGVTLTNSLFLKQMATLATFMSSLAGVLLRRYL